MKSFLLNLFSIIIITSSILYTQESPTSKGVYRLSGAISGDYSVTSDDLMEDIGLSVMIAPGCSYFVADNLELGLNLVYHNWDATMKYKKGVFHEVSYNNHYFSIGPNFRYYLPVSALYPFIGAAMNFEVASKDKAFLKDLKISATTISGGMDFFVSKNVAIEPALIYNIYNYAYYQNSTSLTLGVSINYCIF